MTTYGEISDDMVGSWLEMFQNSALWASAHFEVPLWTDPGATEAADAGYSRQRLTWVVESGRAVSIETPLIFPSLSNMFVVAVGFWDAQTNGAMCGFARPIPGKEIYIAGTGTVTIPAGQITVRLAGALTGP